MVQSGLMFLGSLAVHADNKVPLMAYADLVRSALVAHSGLADVVGLGRWFLAALR